MFKSFFEVVSWPDFTINSWRWMYRPLSHFRARPFYEVFALIWEPVLLLFVLAYGLGHWLPEVEQTAYPKYVLPTIAIFTAILIPFWENSFAVFSRLKAGHCYKVAQQSPISAQEIASGEIVWAALKGTLAAQLILLIGLFLGWSTSSGFWFGIIVVLPTALIASSLGLWCAARFQRPTAFILVQGLFLLPLMLWSDGLFPASALSPTAAAFVLASPVGHAVHSLRGLTLEQVGSDFFLHISVLLVLMSLSMNIATRRFRKSLER